MDSLIITLFITVCDTIYPVQVKVPPCDYMPVISRQYFVEYKNRIFEGTTTISGTVKVKLLKP